MNPQSPKISDAADRVRRPTMVLGYLALGICVSATLWGAVLSLSILNADLVPADIASIVLEIDRQIDDPMILARDSDLSLIEPAAGPDRGCE